MKMKKVLLVAALWSLPAFSAEALPGEHSGASAAEAAKELADAQAEQQKAQEELQKEQDQERAREVALQQAQEAAKAHPTDPAAQQAAAAAQSDLTVVEGQIAEQQAVVTADSQEVTVAQAAAIEAAKGSQTIPGSGPDVPMENQPVTIDDLQKELAANAATQARIRKEIEDLPNTTGMIGPKADRFNAERDGWATDLTIAQRLATGLTNARDFLQFATDNGSTVQFTNGDIDNLFLSGNFLLPTALSPDASALSRMAQTDLATRLYGLQDALTAVDSMSTDGTITFKKKQLQLFTGDDVEAKGDILKQFITDREQVLIDPLLKKTTTLSALTSLMSGFPTESRPKIIERAQAIITNFTDAVKKMGELVGSSTVDSSTIVSANQLVDRAGKYFSDTILDAAEAAFPDLKDALTALRTSRNSVQQNYAKLVGVIFSQITATKDQLATLLTTSDYNQQQAIASAKDLLRMAKLISSSQLDKVEKVFPDFTFGDDKKTPLDFELLCSRILGDLSNGFGTFSELVAMESRPLIPLDLSANLAVDVVNPVEALFYTDFHSGEGVFSIPTRLEALSVLKNATFSSLVSASMVVFIKDVVSEYTTLLNLQSQARAKNTEGVEAQCRALYDQVVTATTPKPQGGAFKDLQSDFRANMKSAINGVLARIGRPPLGV